MSHVPIIIIVEPIARPGYFQTRVGSRALCTSREPFLAGARALLQAGYAASAAIVMRSPGCDVDRLRSTIGAAARLTVSEDTVKSPRFRRFKARQDAPRLGEGSPRIAQTLAAGAAP
jgi:hypothetical protein